MDNENFEASVRAATMLPTALYKLKKLSNDLHSSLPKFIAEVTTGIHSRKVEVFKKEAVVLLKEIIEYKNILGLPFKMEQEEVVRIQNYKPVTIDDIINSSIRKEVALSVPFPSTN